MLRGNPGVGNDILRLSDRVSGPSEVLRSEMLQNKKVAPISGGSKSFVCMRRTEEKVTE
jgi:hypothetical protein